LNTNMLTVIMDLIYNRKIITDLKYLIGRLEKSDFEESHILDLFIKLRPFFKNQTLIFEIASFFAHPEKRDRGISHQSIDVNYAKLKLIVEGNKINLFKIDKFFFENIFIGGINDLEKVKFNKNASIKLLRNSYELNEGFYTLTAIENLDFISKIINLVFGVIHSRVILVDKEIITSLKIALNKVNIDLKLNYDIKYIINKNKDDILICIMCLLNQSEFKLYDKSIGRIVMKLHNEETVTKYNVKVGLFSIAPLNNNNVIFPFMSLIDNVFKYFDKKSINEISEIEFDTLKLMRNSDNLLHFHNYK